MTEKIPRLYENCKIVIAAIGPSLTTEVIETVRKYKDTHVVLGINDAYKVIDFMDEFYACDGKWWKVHGDLITKKCPGLNMWTHDDEGTKYGARQVKGKGNAGLSTNPEYIHTGCNSGFQALNLAVLWGCTKIILVGYNLGHVQGKAHFWGGGRESTLAVSSPYDNFIRHFDKVQPQFRERIVNCTEHTKLNTFRKGNLEEELQSD